MNILKYLRNKWHNDLLLKQTEIQCTEQNIASSHKNEILSAISWNNLEVIRLRDGLIRTTPRKIIKLCFDIIEKCNLNCAGCLVYSPLANEHGYIMNINNFEQDIARLSELFTEQEVSVITLSGGEPLLHPDIEKFPKIIRRFFPNVNIRIVTNGILLFKQPDSFWQCCKENHVVLEQTKYPIPLDFAKIKQLAETNEVKHIFMEDTGEHEKSMQIFPVDLESMSENAVNSQNERLNFFNCWEANQCIRVQDGQIYTCSRIPHIHLLNERFHLNYKVTEDDSFDIYTAENKKEIYDFLASAVPFCRYCKVHAISEGHPWKKSTQALEEWAN